MKEASRKNLVRKRETVPALKQDGGILDTARSWEIGIISVSRHRLDKLPTSPLAMVNTGKENGYGRTDSTIGRSA